MGYKIDIFYVLSFLSFFFIQIVYSQKIYNKNYFGFLLIVSLIYPSISLLFIKEEKIFTILLVSLLLPLYALLLLLIKVFYRKINKFFIKRKIVNILYKDKDFTYVQWNSKNPTSPRWWDEKQASPPSFLDNFLTLLLLVLPILIIIFISFLA